MSEIQVSKFAPGFRGVGVKNPPNVQEFQLPSFKMMSSEKGHWVEELFPPAFQYSAENFNLKGERNVHSNNQERRALLTAENIRDIYQRVSSLSSAEEKRTKQVVRTEQSKSDIRNMIPERDIPKSHSAKENFIWTTDELNFFRKEFCSSKKENLQLNVKVRELKKYCKYLEETIKASMKGSDSMTTKLSDLKKANKRQTIHNDILTSELKSATSTIETLHQMNANLTEERDNLSKKSSELQVQLNKERIEKIKLDECLEHAKANFTNELMYERESLRNTYEVKIQSLRSDLDAVVKDYNQERDQHISTKHGLQDLLRHFSSLMEKASIKKDNIHSLK